MWCRVTKVTPSNYNNNFVLLTTPRAKDLSFIVRSLGSLRPPWGRKAEQRSWSCIPPFYRYRKEAAECLRSSAARTDRAVKEAKKLLCALPRLPSVLSVLLEATPRLLHVLESYPPLWPGSPKSPDWVHLKHPLLLGKAALWFTNTTTNTLWM